MNDTLALIFVPSKQQSAEYSFFIEDRLPSD
jgi:hypothetical protein